MLVVEIAWTDDVPEAALHAAAEGIEEEYGATVTFAGPFPVPAQAFDATRGQYRASLVIASVPPPRTALRQLAIVGSDLYQRGLNFVFGIAVGPRALISTARLLQPGRAPAGDSVFLRRVKTEAVHELGHTFGLQHCSDSACAMYFSNTLADTDRKGYHLCERCRRLAARAIDSIKGGSGTCSE